uniref:Uncharacterized protein n=1 Tax=Arundo donax TaxID=35708 RepID=A0A0A9BZS9_ARUDO
MTRTSKELCQCAFF